MHLFYRIRLPRLVVCASLALALQACAYSRPADYAVPEAQLNDPHRPVLVAELPNVPGRNPRNPQIILTGDKLEVDVYLEDSLDKEVTVDRSGRIVLPLIGSVGAAGRSVTALASHLEDRYRETHLQNPEISVFITETIEPVVTVDGAVTEPGLYPVNDRSTLLQMMAEVGGLTDVADPHKVYVFRNNGYKKLVANYSVRAMREGIIPDLRIYEGDTIVVFESNSKVALNNLAEALGVAAVFATVSNAATN